MSDCIGEVLAIVHDTEMPEDRTAVKAARHGRSYVRANTTVFDLSTSLESVKL